MKRLLGHLEKILLGLAIVALLVTAGFAYRRLQGLETVAALNPAAGVAPAPYEPARAELPVIEAVVWPDAGAQSRGKDWIYDVFTPPVIYYNRETGEFTVTPPTVSERVVNRIEAPFEVELLAVRQEPFRIQLVGYVGADGSPLATFEVLDVGETVVGRAGRVFERGEFTLRSFEVRRMTSNPRDSMPVVENIGVAVIIDDRTGREETLTTRERKMLPRLQAVLRVQGNPPEDRVVREGGSIQVNGFSYLVTRLTLNPAQAVISRRAPDSLGASETRTLSPRATDGSAGTRGDFRPANIFSFSSP